MTVGARGLAGKARLGATMTATLVAALAALSFAVDQLMDWAAARTLESYAAHRAHDWAGAGGHAPETPLEEGLLAVARFDALGRPLPAPGAAEGPPAPAAAALARTRPALWARLRAGETMVRLGETAADPAGPAGTARRWAEVHLPLPAAGGAQPGTAAAGYARLRFDQSDIAGELAGALRRAGVGLTLLAGLAVLIPSLASVALRARAREARAAARHAARADLLTGLPNRAGFRQEAAAVLRRAAQEGAATAVISIDIDRFRAFNDHHGAAAGDAVLRRAAAGLRRALRRGDLLGRLGADEFAALVRLRRGEDLGPLLERLAQLMASAGAGADSAASLGGCRLSPGRDALETALRRAELARAEARMEGGGRARLFEPEMEARLNRARRVERSLREGRAAGRFSLVYQPLVGARGGRAKGVEALMRLRDADGAPIPPCEFIPVAEATGEICALGAWALREAAAAAARLPAPLSVSVNLSPVQFRDGRLVPAVAEALEASGLPPERLELEITESLLVADPDQAERQLAELRAMGVSLAMDDFGAGYSSLAYLWRFRLDRLKLDRSFAQALAADPVRARDMIAAIVALGHRLGMRVTAEGVETEAQARSFMQLGCDDLQGYLFGAPAPEAELKEILRWTRDAEEERLALPHARRAGAG